MVGPGSSLRLGSEPDRRPNAALDEAVGDQPALLGINAPPRAMAGNHIADSSLANSGRVLSSTGHAVGSGNLMLRATFGEDGGDDKTSLRHPADPEGSSDSYILRDPIPLS